MSRDLRTEAMLRLNAVNRLPTFTALRIWERLGERFIAAAIEEIAEAGELGLEEALRVKTEAAKFDAGNELALAQERGARVMRYDDPDFPQLLRSIYDPPLVLYIRGEAKFNESRTALAFVGSRRATAYGLRTVKALVRDAAQAGAVIVSGLARGIDGKAHETALENGAPTWAVLGSGLARMYPAEHAGLADRIAAAGGAVLSEWPMKAPPLDWHFPRRNRIIAGLSWGTVVVEGTLKSGSLSTATSTIKQGREVFAVPGPVDSALSDGPNMLIGQGARLTRNMTDVWEGLPPGTDLRFSLYKEETPVSEAKRPGLSLEQRKILEYMGSDARTLDELVLACGLDLPRLSNIIFEMELRDLVVPVPGQRYAKKGS